MMKISKTAAVGISACAAACAGASLVPMIAGSTLLGLGSFGFSAWALDVARDGVGLDTIICIGGPLLAGAIALGFYWRSRRISKNKANSCAADGSCGCSGHATAP